MNAIQLMYSTINYIQDTAMNLLIGVVNLICAHTFILQMDGWMDGKFWIKI